MTEEKKMIKEHLYKHSAELMTKVHKMFESGELTPAQMAFAGDIMKDISKTYANLSKACYYDSMRGENSDKTY